MASLALKTVLDEPTAAVVVLEDLPCVESATLLRASCDEVVLRLLLLPYDPTGTFIRQGYPIEELQLVIHGGGSVRAIPKSGRGRSWLHRNSIAGVWLDLCLWDPSDPEPVRWSWDDGLEEYVRIVSRHLIYEEYRRRHGEWPVEDSPHGTSPTGRWPIRTREMKKAARRWGRG